MRAVSSGHQPALPRDAEFIRKIRADMRNRMNCVLHGNVCPLFVVYYIGKEQILQLPHLPTIVEIWYNMWYIARKEVCVWHQSSRTEKLRKVYAVGKERVVALNNVDLSIEKGEFCCIVGQSGSGKSTLLNQLAGLEKPTSGKVYIGKHEISKMTENELAEFRQQHLGFIFQSYNLLPTMTAAENVALPLMFKGVDKKTRLARARKELKSMGLLGRANHLPTEMSGGQQQRVGIARAFVSSPKVIFADEPTGNLDSRTSKQVLYRMLEMSKNSGVTFVMVTHEPDLAECADRIVTILDGKVCSNVVQDEETKKKNRDALFADLEGNLDIGGEAAKEQNEKIKDNR